MKFQLHVVCLFALFSIVFTLTKEEENKIAETCMKQTKASNDDMKIFDENNDIPPKTKTQYCLLACYYKAVGTMDANNKLIYEKAVIELEPLKKENKDDYDKYNNMLKECTASTTPAKEECDSLQKYFDCMKKRAKDMGIDL